MTDIVCDALLAKWNVYPDVESTRIDFLNWHRALLIEFG
ncbi:hypothetical protein VDG1235_696 [Verrucomicrobiia bacterium DG1235]|nr:hypothetical protein VDG1235_696 [Verrucomicrobiae bacterium DG1235]